jgi:hypothetical protein
MQESPSTRLGTRLSRALVQYYVALRLSAAAATEHWPLEPKPEPPAIVRVSPAACIEEFDPRECYRGPEITGVVTLPTGRGGIPTLRGFSPN